MFKKQKERKIKAKEQKRMEYTKVQLKREIEHYKAIISGKFGKPTESNIKECQMMIDTHQKWLDNFDKLDINKDGKLDESEVSI